MPILDINYKQDIVTATQTSVELDMPIQLPVAIGRGMPKMQAMNIHAIEFLTEGGQRPATGVTFTWELKSKDENSAYQGKLAPEVLAEHIETWTVTAGPWLDSAKDRKKEFKIPILNVKRKLYLNVLQGSGGNIEMGVRIYYTLTTVPYSEYLPLIQDFGN